MRRLEVSDAVRPLEGSLSVKWLTSKGEVNIAALWDMRRYRTQKYFSFRNLNKILPVYTASRTARN